jgi:predicted amidohydrolase
VRGVEGRMTANGNLKRRVRARATKTGESYAAALRHFRPTSSGDEVSTEKSIRLAVTQTVLGEDPARSDELRRSGQDIRRLMRAAHDQGARVIQFPEGATCSPHKLVMSGPEQVGPSDWDRADWAGLQGELAAVAALAGELRLWTVLGAVHRLTPPHRPYNSLYVISDQGAVVTRYDERLLSNTKVSYMYSPGAGPVTFDVDGVRFGCTLGMEAHYPELFAEYERLDVDCVLFSTTGDGPLGGPATFAAEVQGHAATNSFWVSLSLGAAASRAAPAGIVAPGGEWHTRCRADGAPGVVVTTLDNTSEAVTLARPWRRVAIEGAIYSPHQVEADPRTARGAGF